MRKLLRRILFPNTYSSEAYINYLRKKGIDIGNNCYIWSPNHTFIDEQNSCLLKIGNYVKIAYGVRILSHDYSVSVAKRCYHQHIGQSKKTHIGNNVFIGMNSIILPGTEIGDNVIIGAGSVVHGKIESNTVVSGNPAKKICTLEYFYNKKKKNEIKNAIIYINEFYKKNNKYPTLNEMGNAYAWLYLERTKDNIKKFDYFFRLSGDNYEETIYDFLNSTPCFDGYDKFLEYAISEINKEEENEKASKKN